MLTCRIHAKEDLRIEPTTTAEVGPGEVLVHLGAGGICGSDLHYYFEGRNGSFVIREPLIPGHEIIGTIIKHGQGATAFSLGTRVGVPWLGWTCGECKFCRTGRENLCEKAQFTGYTRDGGYAEYIVADERFCFPVPEPYPNSEAAPLLCAGLIGYRSLAKTGEAKRLGTSHVVRAARSHACVQRADDGSVSEALSPPGAQKDGSADERQVVHQGGRRRQREPFGAV